MIDELEGISFDFGNTLVPFPARDRDVVLAATAQEMAPRLQFDPDQFIAAWLEERGRQFVEDVPEGREANMDVRAARVLARLAGMCPPPADQRWDDDAARTAAPAGHVEAVLDSYANAFVRLTPVPVQVGPMLRRLASRYRLAVLSNWPLGLSIERYVENAGWSANLSAVVVSQRVGAIKPRREIFEAAALALAVPSGPRILHVGDDPGADVVGARNVGWRTAWVRMKPQDSFLPVAPPADVSADITIDTVADLEAALALS